MKGFELQINGKINFLLFMLTLATRGPKMDAITRNGRKSGGNMALFTGTQSWLLKFFMVDFGSLGVKELFLTG